MGKPIVPMNLGPVVTPAGIFRPTGPLLFEGDSGLSGTNEYKIRRWKRKGRFRWPWQHEPISRGFRFIVGLHSDPLNRDFQLDDVREAVRTERLRQTGHAGSSFIRQEGLWTEAGQTESSIQVAVIHTPWETGESEEAFEENMLELGSILASAFGQFYIHGEYQENGIVVGVVEFGM